MKKLHFTDEFGGSLAALSMQYYHVFEKPSEELVIEYICGLENGKLIYNYIQNHQNELSKSEFDEDLFDKKYPFDNQLCTFNKPVYLFTIFMFLYVFCYNLEQEDFYDLDNLQEIRVQSIIINSLISSLVMQYDLITNMGLDFNSLYIPSTSMLNYINIIYKNESFLKTYAQFELDNDLRQLNQDIDKEIIKNQYTFMKIQAILLLMESSNLYSKKVQKIAKNIILLFKELLFNVKITKIIVDASIASGVIRDGFRKTTAIKIFFALENLDRYCLRIDFPHEGEEFLHYNLHERGRTTGLPLNIYQYNQLVIKYGDLENIFFHFNNKFWFRNDFKIKLNDFYPGDNNHIFREEMLELFQHQSHYQLSDDEIKKDEMFDFISAFGIALSHMKIDDFFYGDTSEENIDYELDIIKCKDILYISFMEYQKLCIYEKMVRCSCKLEKIELKDCFLHSLLNCYEKIEIDFATYDELIKLDLKEIFIILNEYLHQL